MFKCAAFGTTNHKNHKHPDEQRPDVLDEPLSILVSALRLLAAAPQARQRVGSQSLYPWPGGRGVARDGVQYTQYMGVKEDLQRCTKAHLVQGEACFPTRSYPPPG